MSIARSSLFFSVGTIFSRLTGLLRESVVAYFFGASFFLDCFLVANRIPNLLRELAAEGALGASFTKIFVELKEKDNKRAQDLLLHILIWVSLLLTSISVLGMIFAEELVGLFTLFKTTREAEFLHHAAGLTRLLFGSIVLMSQAAVLSGVLHQRNRFFTSAIAPALLNFGYIFGALILAQYVMPQLGQGFEEVVSERKISGLAFGVLLGGLLQVLFLLILVWRENLGPALKRFSSSSMFHSDAWTQNKRVLVLMLPMVLAAGSGQINALVNTNFATSLEPGAVSWLNYAFRLLQLPIGVFAVAIGSAALPQLTRAFVGKSNQAKLQNLSVELEKILVLGLWLLVPCFCFYFLNSFSVIKLLFFHGAFSEEALMNTSQVLFFYSFGLVGFGLVKIITSFFYAVEKTRFPMFVGLFSIAANFTCNYLLVDTFGFRGLAMTASCMFLFNGICLLGGSFYYGVRFAWVRCGIHLMFLIVGFFLANSLQNSLQNWFGQTSLKIDKLQDILVLGGSGLLIVAVFTLSYLACDKLGSKIYAQDHNRNSDQ